jgi:phospholipase C
MPLDHTSILKTIERRWQLKALTARDAAAQDIGAVLTLATARTDDPLQGVVVPTAKMPASIASRPSHLQEIQAQLASQLPVPDRTGRAHHALPRLRSNKDYRGYIRRRMAAWLRSRS